MSGGGFRGRGFGQHRARFNSPGSGGRNNGPRNGPRHPGNYQRGNFNNSQSQPLLHTPGPGRRSGPQENWSQNRPFPRWEHPHGTHGNNQPPNWSHNRGESYQNSPVRFPYQNNDSYHQQGGRGHYRGGRGRRGGGGSGGGGGGDHCGDGGGYRYSEPRESGNYYNPPYYNAPYREFHQPEKNTVPEEPVPPLLGSEEERQQKITEAADELKRKLLTNRTTTTQEETNWYEDFNIPSLSATDVEENVIKAIPELKHGPPELDLTLSDLKDIGRVDIDNTFDPSAINANIIIQTCDESYEKEINQRNYDESNEDAYKMQKTPLITLDYSDECGGIGSKNVTDEMFINKSDFDTEVSFENFEGMAIENLAQEKYYSNLSTEITNMSNVIETEHFDIPNVITENNPLDKSADENQACAMKSELMDQSSNLKVCSVQNSFDSFSLAFNNSTELMTKSSSKTSDLNKVSSPNEIVPESSSIIDSKNPTNASYQEQLTQTNKDENSTDVNNKNKKKIKKKSPESPLGFDPRRPPPLINQSFTQNEDILQPPAVFDPRLTGMSMSTIVHEFDPQMPPPIMGSQEDTNKPCSSFSTHLPPMPAIIPSAPITGAPINMPSTMPGYAHPSFNPMVPYVPTVPIPFSQVITPVEYPLAQMVQPPLPLSTVSNPPSTEQVRNKPETNGDPNLSVDEVLGEMNEAMEFAKQCMVMGDNEDVIEFPTLPNLPPLPESVEVSIDKSATKQKKMKKTKQDMSHKPHPKSRSEKTEKASDEQALASIKLPEAKIKLFEETLKIPEDKRKLIEEKKKLIEDKRKLNEEKSKFIEEKDTFTEEINKVYEDESTSDDLGRRKVMFNLNAKFKKLNKTEEWASESIEEEEKAKQRRLKILSSPAVAVVAPTTMTTTTVTGQNKYTNHEEKISEIVKDSSSSDSSDQKQRDQIQTRSKNKEKQANKTISDKNDTHDVNKKKNKRSTRTQPTSDSKLEKNNSHNELIAEKINEVKTYTSKLSSKKATPTLTESSWKNRVITRFLKMSKNDIQNMINNSSLRKFDIAMQHLVKEKKSSLSLEMRLNEDEKMKNSNYDNEDFMSQLQAILDPAATVDITNLPTTFIHQLSEVLHLDPLPTDLDDLSDRSESLISSNQEPSIQMTDQSTSISIPNDLSRHVTTNVPSISTSEMPKPRKINNKPTIDVMKNISTMDSSTGSRTRSKRNEVDANVQRSTTNTSVTAPMPSVSTMNNLNMDDLDDIFTAGIRAKSKLLQASQTTSKVFTTSTERIVMPTKKIETTYIENNEIPTADLDKIFSAVIAKTKASSMKTTTATNMEPSEREQPHLLQREPPGSVVTSWKRKGIDDPDNFRNLTKEEYEARYGDFSHPSNEDETRTVTFKSRRVILNGRDTVTYPVQTNKNFSYTTAPSIQATMISNESGEDSGSEGETSTSSTSSSSSDDESLDVTKVLKFIKEREKIAKKKSINEEIRDEVSAEIERKRKEKNAKHKSHKSKSKKKEKKKKDKERRVRKKKPKKRRKRKPHHEPSTNVSENEDGERPLWLLRDDEIKREPYDEPLKDAQEPSSLVTQSKTSTSLQILPTTSGSKKMMNHIVNTTTILPSTGILLRRPPVTYPNQITTNSTVSNIIKNAQTPSSSSLSGACTACSSNNRSSQSPLPHTKTKAQLKQMPETLTKTKNNKPVSTESLNNLFTDEPIKTESDVNETNLTVKQPTTIQAMSPTSGPRKLDIKQYQERTIQRKLREKERGKAVAENPSILTQNLLNLPPIKKPSTEETNQSNLRILTEPFKSVANLPVNPKSNTQTLKKTLGTVSVKTSSLKTNLEKDSVEAVSVNMEDVCKTAEKPIVTTSKTHDIPQRRKLIRRFSTTSTIESQKIKGVEENKFANIKSEGGKELKLKEKLKRKPSKPVITDVTVLSNKVAVPRSRKQRNASSSLISLTSTNTSNADKEAIKNAEASTKSLAAKKNAPLTRASSKLKNLNKDMSTVNIELDESLNKIKEETSELERGKMSKLNELNLSQTNVAETPSQVSKDDPNSGKKVDIKDKVIENFSHYFTPSKNIKSDGFPDVVTYEMMEVRVEIRKPIEIVEKRFKILKEIKTIQLEKPIKKTEGKSTVINEDKVAEIKEHMEIIEEKFEIKNQYKMKKIENPTTIIEEKSQVMNQDKVNEIQNPAEIIEEKSKILSKEDEIITQNETENTIDVLEEPKEQLINPILNEEMKREISATIGYSVESIPITPQFDETIEKDEDMLAEDEKLLIDCDQEENVLNKQDIVEEEEKLLLEINQEKNMVSEENITEEEIISSENPMELQDETIKHTISPVIADDNFSENIALVSTVAFPEEIEVANTQELTTEQLPDISDDVLTNDKILSEVIVPEINLLSESLEKNQEELVLNETEILSKTDHIDIINTENDAWNVVEARNEDENDITPVIIDQSVHETELDSSLLQSLPLNTYETEEIETPPFSTQSVVLHDKVLAVDNVRNSFLDDPITFSNTKSPTPDAMEFRILEDPDMVESIYNNQLGETSAIDSIEDVPATEPFVEDTGVDSLALPVLETPCLSPETENNFIIPQNPSEQIKDTNFPDKELIKEIEGTSPERLLSPILQLSTKLSDNDADDGSENDDNYENNPEENVSTITTSVVIVEEPEKEEYIGSVTEFEAQTSKVDEQIEETSNFIENDQLIIDTNIDKHLNPSSICNKILNNVQFEERDKIEESLEEILSGSPSKYARMILTAKKNDEINIAEYTDKHHDNNVRKNILKFIDEHHDNNVKINIPEHVDEHYDNIEKNISEHVDELHDNNVKINISEHVDELHDNNVKINIPEHDEHYDNNVEKNIPEHVDEHHDNNVEKNISIAVGPDKNNENEKMIENTTKSPKLSPDQIFPSSNIQSDKDSHKDDPLKKHRRSKSRTPTHDQKKSKKRHHHHHRKKSKLTLEKVEEAIATDIVKPVVITKDSVMMRMQEIDLAIQKLMDEKMTLYRMLKDDKWPSVPADEPSTSTDSKTDKPITHPPFQFTDKLMGRTPRVVVARLTESAMKQAQIQRSTSPPTEFPLPKPESSSTPKQENSLCNKPSKTEDKKTKPLDLNEHITPKSAKKRKHKEEKDHKEDKEHKARELKNDGSPDAKKRLHSEEFHQKHKKSPTASKNNEESIRKPFKLSQLLKTFKPKTPAEKRRSTSPKEHRAFKSQSTSSEKNVNSSKELIKPSKNDDLEDSEEETNKVDTNISSEKNKGSEKDKKIEKVEEISKKSSKDHGKISQPDSHLIYSDDSTLDHLDRFGDKSERSTGLVLLEESIKREKAVKKAKATTIKKKIPNISKKENTISSDTEDSMPLVLMLARKKSKKKQLATNKKLEKHSNIEKIPKEDHSEEIIDAVATNRIGDLYDSSKKKQYDPEKSDKCLKTIKEKLADKKTEENKEILENVKEKKKSEKSECNVKQSEPEIDVSEVQSVEENDEINNKNNTEQKEVKNTRPNTSEFIKPALRIEEHVDEVDEENISDEGEWTTLDSVGFVDDKDDEYEQASDNKLEPISSEEEYSNNDFVNTTEKKLKEPSTSMISPLIVEENNINSVIQDTKDDHDHDNNDDGDDDHNDNDNDNDKDERNPQHAIELQQTLLKDWIDSPRQPNDENNKEEHEAYLNAKSEKISQVTNSGVDINGSNIIASEKMLDNNAIINKNEKQLTINENADEDSLPTRISVESTKFLNTQKKEKKDEKVEEEKRKEEESKKNIKTTNNIDDHEEVKSTTQMNSIEKEAEHSKSTTQELEKSKSEDKVSEKLKSTIKDLEKYRYLPKKTNRSISVEKQLEESEQPTIVVEDENQKSTTQKIEKPKSTTQEQENLEGSKLSEDELEKLGNVESPIEELVKPRRAKSTVKELEEKKKPRMVVKGLKKPPRPKSTIRELEKLESSESSDEELKESRNPKSKVKELKKPRRSKSTVLGLRKLESSESSDGELKKSQKSKPKVKELKKPLRPKSTVRELKKLESSESSDEELKKPQKSKPKMKELKRPLRPKSTVRELKKLESSESSDEELKKPQKSKPKMKELKRPLRPKSTVRELRKLESSESSDEELKEPQKPKSKGKELKKPRRSKSTVLELKKLESSESSDEELKEPQKSKTQIKELKKPLRPKSTVRELKNLESSESSEKELNQPQRSKSTVKDLKKPSRLKSTVKELEKLQSSKSSEKEPEQLLRLKPAISELEKTRSPSPFVEKEMEDADTLNSIENEFDHPNRPASAVKELETLTRPEALVEDLKEPQKTIITGKELEEPMRPKSTVEESSKPDGLKSHEKISKEPEKLESLVEESNGLQIPKSTVKELETPDRPTSTVKELEESERPKPPVEESEELQRPKSTVKEVEKLKNSDSSEEELKIPPRPKSSMKELKKRARSKSTVKELEKLRSSNSSEEELEEPKRAKSTIKELKNRRRSKSTVKELERSKRFESPVEELEEPKRPKSTVRELKKFSKSKSIVKELEKSKASTKDVKEEKSKSTIKEMERSKSTVKELEKLKSKLKIMGEDDFSADGEVENEEPVKKKRDRRSKNPVVSRRSSRSSRQSDDSNRTSRSRSRSARLRKSPSLQDTLPSEVDSKDKTTSTVSTGSVSSRRRSAANVTNRETVKPDTKSARNKRKRPNTDDYDLDLLTKCKVRLIDYKLICHGPDLHVKFLEKHGISRINNWMPQEELLGQETSEEELERPLSIVDEDKNHSDDDSMELIQVEEADELQTMDTLESLPDDNAKDAEDQHKNSPMSSEFTGSPQAVELPESDLENDHEGEGDLEIVESDIEVLEKQPSPVNTPISVHSESAESTEQRRTQYTVHKGPILDIKVFGDSFLAASEDGAIYRYSQRSNGILNIYKGHDAAVTCLYIHEISGTAENGTTRWNLFSGSLDATLRCYDIMNGSLDRQIVEIGSPIQCMDQAWGCIFIGTKSGHISRYDIKSGCQKENQLDFSDKPVLALRASTEGPRKILIVASRNQPITIRDAQNGLFLRTISGQRNHTVYSLLMDRNLVYCGTSNTSIPVFDFISGEQICQYTAGVGIVCMRLYKQLLFAGCYDGNIYVFDINDQKLICSIPGPGNMLLSMEIIDDEIIAGSKDRRLHAWRMPSQIRSMIIDRT